MTNDIVTTNAKPKAPWIGCGTSGIWSSVKEAMEACDLNFEVESKEVKFSYDEGGMTYYDVIPGYKATVRTDTHKPLGCVSGTYKVVQNSDIFPMLDPFVQAGGLVTAGGMTEQGLCFMVVTMNDAHIAGDDYTINVMATNSFNGQFPASLICSPIRIVCQNMYRSLMNNSDNVARFRHSLNITGRLDAMKAAYEVFTDFTGQFASEVENLKKLQAAHTIDEFVEEMFPYSKISEDSPRYQSARDRVDERRALYVNKYYNSPTNSDHGTCFALVNAYYDYVSHDVPVRKTEDEYRDKRFSSLVGGKMISPKLMSYMCESK